MKMFELAPQLAADTEDVGMLGLCRVLLMRDARYPWLTLVPAKPDLVEITDLAPADRRILIEEIVAAGETLTDLYKPEKINTGALGNIVRQLHVHIVARNTDDPAWPAPVWGHSPALDYEPRALKGRLEDIRSSLSTT